MPSDDAEELRPAHREESPSEASNPPSDYEKSPSEASDVVARHEKNLSHTSKVAASPSEASNAAADYEQRPSEALNVASGHEMDLSETSNATANPPEASNAAADHDTPLDPEPRRRPIVVAVPALTKSQIGEYQEIHSDVVERVVEELVEADGRDLFYQVEFRDGRHDMVGAVTSLVSPEYGR